MLHELIYTSIAIEEMDQKGLEDILFTANNTNKELDITGMLVYHNRTFIQLLEGDKTKVEELYKKIIKDKRHTSAEIFWQDSIKQRSFANWSMAFSTLHSLPEDLKENYSPFLELGFTSELVQESPNDGHELLLELQKTL